MLHSISVHEPGLSTYHITGVNISDYLAPQVVQPEVLGASRSTLPVTTLIQTPPVISTNTLRSPDGGSLLVRLGDQQNRFASSDNQNSKLKLTTENENGVIKLAQVPLSLLDEKTEHVNDIKIANPNEKISEDEDSNAIKLDRIKPLSLKDESKEKSKEDINKEALKTLQSRLTTIISKLERKVNKSQGTLKQPRKEESLRKIAKDKPSEKSLTLLKKRLAHVLEKFNSKPGAGQPFTIGQEWRNVLSENTPSNGSEATKVGLKKTKNTTENEGTSYSCHSIKKVFIFKKLSILTISPMSLERLGFQPANDIQ